jgi:hypothetical protein
LELHNLYLSPSNIRFIESRTVKLADVYYAWRDEKEIRYILSTRKHENMGPECGNADD